MAKIIAAINMTLDGFCDHSEGVVDDALHEHYRQLIENAGLIIYGRITYQLMEFWQHLAQNPSGNKPMDAFAIAMDRIPKIVFSGTLHQLDWSSARLANNSIEEEILKIKEISHKDILIGSPSLIVQAMQLGLVNELQLCIHPVILGTGLPLFKNFSKRTELRLVHTKTLGSGAIILYYAV